MFVSLLALLAAAGFGALLLPLPAARNRATLCVALGSGLFFGVAACGVIAALLERSAVTSYGWPLLLLAATASGVFAWRWRALPRSADAALGRGERIGYGLLVLLLLVHGVMLIAEATGKPVYPWDAWDTWMLRVRAMVEFAGAVFVGPAALDPVAHPEAFSSHAAHYPLLFSGAFVWLARLHGGWSDAAVLLAWPVAYLALLLLSHGLLLRRVPTAWALMLTALIAATPFLLVHAALPGYMDLWLAGLLLASAWQLLQALQRPALLPWALLLSLALTCVKLEGTVWLLLLLGAYAMARWTRITAAVLVAGTTLVGVAMLLPNGVHLFGERLVVSHEFLRVPYLGASPLAINPIAGPAMQALLVTATFGITIYVLLGLVMGRVLLRLRDGAPRDLALRREARFWTTFSLLAIAFIVLLFGCTVAGQWALNQTSLSRIVLQVLAVWLIAALPPLETASSSDTFAPPR